MFEELAFNSVKDKIKLFEVRNKSIDGTSPKSGVTTCKLNAITPSLKPTYLHLNAVSSERAPKSSLTKFEDSNIQDRIKFFESSRHKQAKSSYIKSAMVSRMNLSQQETCDSVAKASSIESLKCSSSNLFIPAKIPDP